MSNLDEEFLNNLILEIGLFETRLKTNMQEIESKISFDLDSDSLSDVYFMQGVYSNFIKAISAARTSYESIRRKHFDK